MSYDKVIEQLKSPSVKLDTLARYAQGQNPAVPEFLALAEIKRRQSLVAKSPAPAQTTVQEDLIRSATPQPQPMAQQQMAGLQTMQRPQGVAALPSGMNEQSLAGGGIVAFDDGGYVNEEMQYAGGGIVAFAGDNGSQVEDPDAGLGYFERFKNYINSIGGGQVDRYGNPIRKDGTVVKPGEAAVAGLPGQVQAIRSGRGTGIPTTSAQVKDMMPAEQITGNEDTLFKAERVAKELSPQGQALPTVGEKGRMAATTEADRDASGATKEDMYAKYEKMLAENAAQGKEDRKQDKYMRLLEAGLGIMGGTSQHALTNIGQGAMGAAKGYAQDKAGYRKEDRENVKELMALGMKKEDAQREDKKLAMTEKLYGSHGNYYDAAAKAAGVKAAAAGSGTGTKLEIAQGKNAVALYNKWFSQNPMASQEEQDAAWLQAQQRSGMSGGAPGPATNLVQWGSLGAKS
jgi:hypothetical protein